MLIKKHLLINILYFIISLYEQLLRNFLFNFQTFNQSWDMGATIHEGSQIITNSHQKYENTNK